MIEKLFYKLLIIFIGFTFIKAIFSITVNYILVRLKTKKSKPKNKNDNKTIYHKNIVNKKGIYIFKKPRYEKSHLSIKDFISLGNIKICYYEIFLIFILTGSMLIPLILRIVFLYNLCN